MADSNNYGLVMVNGDISVWQNKKGFFRVNYGLQESCGLSYAQAAVELGQCILHALACDGKLDNNEDGDEQVG
jgi:hypothetical protein